MRRRLGATASSCPCTRAQPPVAEATSLAQSVSVSLSFGTRVNECTVAVEFMLSQTYAHKNGSAGCTRAPTMVAMWLM